MHLRRSVLLLSFFAAISSFSQNLNSSYLEYIETYKETAIHNMRTYKIPASITLAQGLLESGAGKGRLAREANNHFGIKCANDWTGKKIYHDDDAKNECFRSYRHASESYNDHALFLTKRSRYAKLFDLASNDYQGWAYGLSKAGYATDPGYPQKLIKIIDDYQLHQYDNPQNQHRGFFWEEWKSSKEEETNKNSTHEIAEIGSAKYIEIKAGESLESVANELGIKVSKLVDYNELIDGMSIYEGDRIYITKKAKKAPLPYFQHTVKAGESIYSISQLYGIRLKYIYKINKLPADYTANEGDVLKLR